MATRQFGIGESFVHSRQRMSRADPSSGYDGPIEAGPPFARRFPRSTLQHSMLEPTFSEICGRLSEYESPNDAPENARRAAVAILLQAHDNQTRVLLIRRAVKKTDPWSGQIAFPGGHAEHDDSSLQHTAERETLEEVGFDLCEEARFLAGLPPECPMTRTAGRRLSISPFIYALEESQPSFSPNAAEVAEILWAPIGPLLRHESVTTFHWKTTTDSRMMPAFDVDGHTVWGLTFRILNRLFERIHPGYRRLDD